jgi:hypothetical protein
LETTVNQQEIKTMTMPEHEYCVHELACSLTLVKNVHHNAQNPGECLVYKPEDMLGEAEMLINERPHKFKTEAEIYSKMQDLGLRPSNMAWFVSQMQVDAMQTD